MPAPSKPVSRHLLVRGAVSRSRAAALVAVMSAVAMLSPASAARAVRDLCAEPNALTFRSSSAVRVFARRNEFVRSFDDRPLYYIGRVCDRRSGRSRELGLLVGPRATSLVGRHLAFAEILDVIEEEGPAFVGIAGGEVPYVSGVSRGRNVPLLPDSEGDRGGHLSAVRVVAGRDGSAAWAVCPTEGTTALARCTPNGRKLFVAARRGVFRPQVASASSFMRVVGASRTADPFSLRFSPSGRYVAWEDRGVRRVMAVEPR